MCRTSIGIILGILYGTFHEVSTYGLYMYNKYNKREHTCVYWEVNKSSDSSIHVAPVIDVTISNDT